MAKQIRESLSELSDTETTLDGTVEPECHTGMTKRKRWINFSRNNFVCQLTHTVPIKQRDKKCYAQIYITIQPNVLKFTITGSSEILSIKNWVLI